MGSPTAVALMGTYVGYAQVLLEILSYFNWHHATILLETKTLSPWYKGLARQLTASAREHNGVFSLELVLLDVVTEEATRKALRSAKQRSRGLCLFFQNTPQTST